MMCGMFLEAFSSEQLAQKAKSDVKIHLIPHRVLSVPLNPPVQSSLCASLPSAGRSRTLD